MPEAAKPIAEWSDQELSDFVATRIMKWRKDDYYWIDRLGNIAGLVCGAYGKTPQDWNPAQNLEQAFQCQERLTVEQLDEVAAKLYATYPACGAVRGGYIRLFLTATARQRCESMVAAVMDGGG